MAFHFSLDAQALEPYYGDLLLHSRRYFVVKFLKADHELKLAHKVRYLSGFVGNEHHSV